MLDVYFICRWGGDESINLDAQGSFLPRFPETIQSKRQEKTNNESGADAQEADWKVEEYHAGRPDANRTIIRVSETAEQSNDKLVGNKSGEIQGTTENRYHLYVHRELFKKQGRNYTSVTNKRDHKEEYRLTEKTNLPL